MLCTSNELTRLWNKCPDNQEACKIESRDFVPQLDTFFSEAFKETETEVGPTSVDLRRTLSKKSNFL